MIEQLERMFRETRNFMRANRFALQEFVLVGSRARGDNGRKSDFDIVCVVNDDLSIYESRRARHLVFEKVISRSDINVGFKMFTSRQLEAMRLYDSYRLIEFTRGFYSFMGSQILVDIEATPNKKSFLNSIIIQLVFETIARKPFGFNKSVVSYVTKRIRRNNEIGNFFDIWTFRDYEKFLLFSKATWEQRLLESLRGCANSKCKIDMYSYYQTIPHEYINKRVEYEKKIAQNRRG